MVNDAGYRVMRRVDLERKIVLELGPGEITHIKYWKGSPEKYIVVDRREIFLQGAVRRLNEVDVATETIIVPEEDGFRLELEDSSVDIIVSFYSLEHLYPLDEYLHELIRVLKKNGVLIGAIPAEGGIAWGAGRLLTTRRWFKRNTTIDIDKVICWEHPNFAESILATMDAGLEREHVSFWPLRIPSVDMNLVIQFAYHKR